MLRDVTSMVTMPYFEVENRERILRDVTSMVMMPYFEVENRQCSGMLPQW